MDKVDITIIGAGIVGLAIARKLSQKGYDIITCERNLSFGQETSSRNSEVIHTGLYYPPGSLKANLCIRGKSLLYEFCKEHNIGCRKLGKFIVASSEEEVKKVEAIYANANKCSVGNLKIIDGKEVRKREPYINAKMAVFSPDTGILDTHGVMKNLYDYSKSRGVEHAFGINVIKVEKTGGCFKVTVKEPNSDAFCFNSRIVINSAGLWADKVAESAGVDVNKNNYKLYFNKGQYFRIKKPGKFKIKHLVYPPPTKTDLGIHVTPDLADGLRLGPDANYVNDIDYNIDEDSKKIFFESVSRYLKGLELDDIIPDTAGIRPKLQKPGEDVKDFVIKDEVENGLDGFINLLGIESPGLTSCLAIAEEVEKLVEN